MFDVFLDYVKKLLKSRLFPITLIYIALFAVIVNRLFVLQIVNGPTIAQKSELKNIEYRQIDSTRGNIYDRKGVLLASNELTYSVVMEDSTNIETNEQRNEIIYKLIKIIEANGETFDNNFYIKQNEKGELEFTLKKNALLRFKEKVYSWALKDGKLSDEQKNATPQQVFDFMKSGKGYEKITTMFQISDQYSVADALKIMSIRYALFCNYPKYVPITVASNVSDKTIAAVEENSSELTGVNVEQQTHRVYENSVYFSNIIGYTGLISQGELDNYNADKQIYDSSDVIGKTGLEKEYEKYLKGKKGQETVSVNSLGKIIQVEDSTEPVAGNDVYLTIDADLQMNVYKLLEREIANILLENITQNMDYGSKGENATDIKIPIYEVYYALINNNIIDINRFKEKNATDLEKSTYNKYKTALNEVFNKLDNYLNINNTVSNDKSGDMEDYLNYFYSELKSEDLLMVDKVPTDDQTLLDYKSNQVSLSYFIKYAISKNWIDLSKLDVGDKYYSTEELYKKLIDKTKELLKKDDKFNKMIYRNLVFSYKLSGTEICLLLFDQDVLKYKDEDKDINDLTSNHITAYDFIISKIKSLEITPAMLALAPCRGSVIITDVKTGDVLAMVSYPSYDNNKFAGKIDADYFKKVSNDLTTPLRNNPTLDVIAPGSTFKMVTSVAALQEGVVTSYDRILDRGIFTNIVPSPKCDIYPGSHGRVNIMDAISVSCNYFFFEMGWRLSLDSSGKYYSDKGLATLKKYAIMFGLNKPSGVELSESKSILSTNDAVRSAIGQGSNAFTPAQLSRYVTTIANRGTCYNLTLLNKIVGNDGKLIKQNSAKVDHTLKDIKASTWDAVQEGMYDVVNSSGGTVSKIFEGLQVKVAGKTGTSQISKSIPNNALFVSYAPYDDPEISVTAVIPNGYTSHNSAFLAKNIYSLYYGYSDIDTLMNEKTDLEEKGSTID